MPPPTRPPPAGKPPAPGAPAPASPPPAAGKPASASTAPKPAPRSPTTPKANRVPRTFSIAPFTDTTEGTKIILYGKTGAGKTTLASMAPDPVFISLDDGGRKIRHPQTGEPIKAVSDVRDLYDVRDALHQTALFPSGSSLVIDTFTKLEAVSEQYIFDNFPIKSGRATNIRAYGWDGAAHQLDTVRLVLTDLDVLVRRGVNVILLCQMGQIRIPNAEGIDYLEDGPKLAHNNQYSSRTEVCEWADHVLRIGYLNFDVQLDNDKAKAGKAKGDLDRAVFAGGAAHYTAKARPIDGKRLPPVVSFAHEGDDSLWQMMFHGAIPNPEAT